MGLAAAIRGFDGFLWGYVVSTCFLMHGTFTINSLAHVYGSRRYETTDTSRNNFWLALITMGEGWHNNHHHYMSSANQGFYWWEIDMSYYILKGLEKVGLIWDVRKAPAHIVEGTATSTSAAA
jgi:stearoyl-CoA desaturase (delta-9 desaturase)